MYFNFTIVPTSTSAQYLGFNYLQNPSKNHKWELSFLPFICFNTKNIVVVLSSLFELEPFILSLCVFEKFYCNCYYPYYMFIIGLNY